MSTSWWQLSSANNEVICESASPFHRNPITLKGTNLKDRYANRNKIQQFFSEWRRIDYTIRSGIDWAIVRAATMIKGGNPITGGTRLGTMPCRATETKQKSLWSPGSPYFIRRGRRRTDTFLHFAPFKGDLLKWFVSFPSGDIVSLSKQTLPLLPHQPPCFRIHYRASWIEQDVWFVLMMRLSCLLLGQYAF